MTQQILNPNSLAPNDKLGDTPFAYTAKLNDNFTELYTSGGLTNVTHINTAADFPAAVGGVRDARVGIGKIAITGTDCAPGGAGGQGRPKVGGPGSSECKK